MFFWKTLARVFPGTRTQRGWVHRTARTLDVISAVQARLAEVLHAAEIKLDWW
jgi:hypothetical protein